MPVHYHTYLASREWALKREAVRKRSGNRCERELNGRRCTKPQHAVHHLTYAHVGNEPLEDLMAVCGDCHEWLSRKIQIDPLAPKKSLFDLELLGPWGHPLDCPCALCDGTERRLRSSEPS